MSIIFFGLLFGLIPLFITSFTGGLAGAIVARGREDRSLPANGGIGLVGWSSAWLIRRLIDGQWPEEITLGLGLLALLTSIIFIHFLERRQTRPIALNENTLTA
jgi:hypothetical protein